MVGSRRELTINVQTLDVRKVCPFVIYFGVLSFVRHLPVVWILRQVSSQDLPPPIWEDLKKDTMAIAEHCYPLQQVTRDKEWDVACSRICPNAFPGAPKHLVSLRTSDPQVNRTAVFSYAVVHRDEQVLQHDIP